MMNEPVVHVIDDDESARHSLRFLLEASGLPVRDYPGALEFLESFPPGGKPEAGCIVTDVRMPDMTGVELIARLKEIGVDEPVIVITGHADVPMAIQAMKAGVSDFLEKPFDDEAIVSAIRSALESRQQELQVDEQRRIVRDRLQSLSRRERQVLDGLVEGKANKVIAYDLGISVRTVEVYRANVMTKMQVRSLSDLVRAALSVRQD